MIIKDYERFTLINELEYLARTRKIDSDYILENVDFYGSNEDLKRAIDYIDYTTDLQGQAKKELEKMIAKNRETRKALENLMNQ